MDKEVEVKKEDIEEVKVEVTESPESVEPGTPVGEEQTKEDTGGEKAKVEADALTIMKELNGNLKKLMDENKKLKDYINNEIKEVKSTLPSVSRDSKVEVEGYFDISDGISKLVNDQAQAEYEETAKVFDSLRGIIR